MADIFGTSGSDFIHVAGDGRTPPPGYNDIPLAEGGDDRISSGGGGNDRIYAGAGDNQIRFEDDWNGDDIVNGSLGFEAIYAYGRTRAVFTDASLESVEEVHLLDFAVPLGKTSYHSLVMANGNVSADSEILINGSRLSRQIGLRLDYSSETDAYGYTVLGGAGNDVITGRSAEQQGHNDVFYADTGGADTIVTAGAVIFGDAFSTSDFVDGLHSAQVRFNGAYASPIVLADAQLRHVAAIRLGSEYYNGPGSEFDYSVVVDESLVTPSNPVSFFIENMAGRSTFIDARGNTDGVVTVWAGESNDEVLGGAGRDIMNSFGQGADSFSGGEGNDVVLQYYTVGNNSQIGLTDHLDGGPGRDTLRINGEYVGGLLLDGDHIGDFEKIVVGADQDPSFGMDLQIADAFLDPGEKLVIDASRLQASNTFTLDASQESDGRIETTGGTGSDQMSAGQGDDTLSGGGGDDTLTGQSGADEIRGGPGDDRMNGGLGNDRYFVDSGGDQTVETNANPASGGIDTVFSTVSRTLNANLEILRLQGTAGINGNGNELNNKLFGNAGANLLKGLAGNDTIEGKDGADTIEGGEGNDTLSGGGQADVFRFATSNTGVDRILDFSKNGDRFDLSGGTFTAISTAANGDAVLTHDGGTVRIANPPNLTLAQWNALVLPPGTKVAIESDDGRPGIEAPARLHDLPDNDNSALVHHGDWAFA